MVKEILINFISLFQDTLAKFILGKTRLRYIYKGRLKEIIKRASPLFDYAGSCTCSLLNLIRIIEEKASPNEIYSAKLEAAEKEMNVLREWYESYQNRVGTTYLSKIGELFNEFGKILLKLQGIFVDLIRDLKEEAVIQKLKRNTYGYPKAKQIFYTTTEDFSKLTGEASQRLKEIKDWGHIFSLPEP